LFRATVDRGTAELVRRLSLQRLAALEAQAQVAQGKGWGTATVQAEVAAIRQLLGPDADAELTILDVGANAGSWTRAALEQFPSAQVHALEPSAAAFDELTATVATHPRVTPHRVALGSSDTEATLYSDAPGSGLASLSKRRLDHFGLTMVAQETVTVRTLPSWLSDAGIARIDVLKLDVEGHELDVLRAAPDVLRETRVVQFEFGGCNIDTRTYWQDYWYLLTAVGFRLHRLGPRGLTAISEYRERDEVFVTTNFFASRAAGQPAGVFVTPTGQATPVPPRPQ
jgi:FkbM family methyltransferase